MGPFSECGEKAAHESGPETKGNGDPGPNGPLGPQMEHKGPATENISSSDAEERKAIMAIDGEQACIHCGDPIDPTVETIPVAGGGVLHMECYDKWLAMISEQAQETESTK